MHFVRHPLDALCLCNAVGPILLFVGVLRVRFLALRRESVRPIIDLPGVARKSPFRCLCPAGMGLYPLHVPHALHALHDHFPQICMVLARLAIFSLHVPLQFVVDIFIVDHQLHRPRVFIIAITSA